MHSVGVSLGNILSQDVPVSALDFLLVVLDVCVGVDLRQLDFGLVLVLHSECDDLPLLKVNEQSRVHNKLRHVDSDAQAQRHVDCAEERESCDIQSHGNLAEQGQEAREKWENQVAHEEERPKQISCENVDQQHGSEQANRNLQNSVDE